MSTGLTIRQYQSSEIAALDPTSETAIAFRENNDGESFGISDLIKVKIPSGGGTIWTVSGPSGHESTEAIEGICVFKAPKGVIWPSLEASGDQKPVVVTNDLVVGKLNIPRDEVPEEMMVELDKCELDGKPGVYDWAKLPYTQWGTGKNGVGKYAKEQMLLFILRPGELLPLFVQVSPGSVKNLRQFFLRSKQVYYRQVISLKLKEEKSKPPKDDPSKGGIKYSQIIPTQTGEISADDGVKIVKAYRDPLKAKHEAGLIELDHPSDDEAVEG